MRKALIAAALCIPLAGCWPQGGTDAKIKELADQFVEGMVKACEYRPTLSSAVAIVSAGDPTVVAVSALVKIACDQVVAYHNKNAATHLFGLGDTKQECPKVNGVCIEGDFVKPKEN